MASASGALRAVAAEPSAMGLDAPRGESHSFGVLRRRRVRDATLLLLLQEGDGPGDRV
jgi:hypothetical protein